MFKFTCLCLGYTKKATSTTCVCVCVIIVAVVSRRAKNPKPVPLPSRRHQLLAPLQRYPLYHQVLTIYLSPYTACHWFLRYRNASTSVQHSVPYSIWEILIVYIQEPICWCYILDGHLNGGACLNVPGSINRLTDATCELWEICYELTMMRKIKKYVWLKQF